MTDTIETGTTEQAEQDSRIIHVPLNKLKKSPSNARKVPHSEATIEALAASIAHKGLIQNLVVEPEMKGDKPTGAYLVTAGEGRRLAYLLRAKRKEIRKNHLVRCWLDTENDPSEVSLDENVTRENMHPADQFERFHELSRDKGWGAEEIGARFAYDVQNIQQAFNSRYTGTALTGDHAQMVANANARWEDSVGAFEDALKVQAGAVGNIEGARTSMDSLVTASQSATGALQAAQAGNQLLALQSQQLADLTATVAAQGRAQVLESARHAAEEAEGRERFRRFMGN